MTQSDLDNDATDRDAIDWDAVPTEPVVHWQPREPVVAPPAVVGVGIATLLVATLGAFALGLLLSERLADTSFGRRSPLQWR